MKLPVQLHHVPGRVAAGLFVLNSGLTKRHVDSEAAAGMHGMAAGTYPFLGAVDAQRFARQLSTGEIALGAALLAPVVPTAVAGTALAGFSAGLLGMYLRLPGMRQEGSLRPTQQGTGIAKDVWLLGIGAGFVLESLTRRRRG
jgi:hypothetical protein